MKNAHQRKRVGLILASLHTGSSLKLWSQLALDAAQGTDPFFIFPGGRLVNKTQSDSLRNAIYNLVNQENLDGLISWSSSIGGGVSIEELKKFHSGFEPLPIVTIGQKISTSNKEYPCVDFEAYSGMKELVKHFFDVHKAKRIAFLQGTANHQSASDRYNAYIDTVKEYGYSDVDIKQLVSSSYSWSDGESAIRELVETRGLVPGKDFDVLIAASDMMLLSATAWLNKVGIRVPQDLLTGGFNDSVESRILSSPFSTVHMPYEELGVTANQMIHEVLDNETPLKDITLATKMVIRESCGCNDIRSWVHDASNQKAINSNEMLVDSIANILKLSSRDKKYSVVPLVKSFEDGDSHTFLTKYGKLVFDYLNAGYEINDLFQIPIMINNVSYVKREIINSILPYIDKIVARMQNRVFAVHGYDNTRLYTALNSLKCNLLTVHDRENLIKTLARDLPNIGIHSMTLVLYENDSYSRYIGGFSAGKIISGEKELFPSSYLVPKERMSDFECGVFVVQPLFMENQPLGYFICSYTNCEGTVYEDLRASISNCVQSILQFEETTAAKSVAEQAEYAKTEFFANVGSDLCDPLTTISEKIDQIEKNVEKGLVDKDILSDQLLFLKSQILTQLEKTETLVDLTRSQIDDLPMDKKLFDIRESLPRAKSENIQHLKDDFPLLYGDSERIAKALLILSEESDGNFSIVAKADGLHINIETGRVNWHLPALQLAEKIIMLQFGEIVKEENRATIIFPWPNLACLVPMKNSSEIKKIISFSDSYEEKSLFGFKINVLSEDTDFSKDENVLILWKPDKAPIEEWLRVYSLRHNSHLFRSPIICYSKELIGHDFIDVLEQKVRTQKNDPVLFVNCKHTRYSPWATDKNSISIPSMNMFEKILEEITPSLIIFESVDKEAIKLVRQNQKTVLVPIIILPDMIKSDDDVNCLCENPRIILCNRGAAESTQFGERIQSILAGDEILPPHTGALVKKAILYLNKNASAQIVRWKLADEVHVSEDYLTRIFHKEIGLSLWEYLNRYRIYLATKMLLETNDTIYEIAENSGFQDQAYFCRVFKKIYGIPPGKIRTNNKIEKQ